MAMVRCAECGRSVSNKALQCPNCGYTVDDICCNCEHFSRGFDGLCDECTAIYPHDHDVWPKKRACPAFSRYEDLSDYE